MRHARLILTTLASCLAAAAHAAQPQLDPGLPAYATVQGVSGNLSSVGSDSMNNLMTLWAEEFARRYPSVKIQIEGKGSSTAPAALIAGSAQLGPMSRQVKPTEIDAFEKHFGYPLTAAAAAAARAQIE